MGEGLTNWVIRWRWLVVAMGLVIAIALAFGGSRLVVSNDYREFFGEDNPQLRAYDEMQAVFNKSDSVTFVIAPHDGNVFSKEHLAGLQTLTKAAWQVPHSRRVDSITNYQYSYAVEDDLIVEDLVLDANAMSAEQLSRAAEISQQEPQLLNRIVSDRQHVSVVNVTVEMPNVDPTKEVPEIAAYVRKLREAYLAEHPDNDVYLSGVVMMNVAFAEASQNDAMTLLPLMFLLIVLAISLLLRTVFGTVATMIVILLSIAGAMGWAGWMSLPLTGPLFSAPTIIMTLAVADCVHVLASMFYEMRQGASKHDALVTSIRINLQPIFLTSATTAIGFLSMNFSDSPPFHDLGNTVAVGVMLAFFLSVTVFPALLSIFPLHVAPHPQGKRDGMGRLSEFVVNNRRLLLPLTTVVMLGFIVLVPFNQTNDDFVKYFHESVPFRVASDFMQENVSGMTLLEVSLDSGKSSGVNNPAFLGELASFTDWLYEQPETNNVLTISDTMKRLNRNMHGDDPAYYTLPESQELAAQFMVLYEFSLPYGLDLNNQLDVEKAATRVIVTLDNLTSNELIAFEERVTNWFDDRGTENKVVVASPSLMFSHIGQRNIKSMLIGTLVALVLISAMLGIALRSVKFGFISLIPNLAPAGIGFGLWYLIDGQIGLGLSVVAGMTLGIIVDDTVHFLSKYLRARREKGLNTVDSVHYAFASVGRALIITTAVLVVGFLVLAQSTFKLNSDMGLLTALTIFIALVVDFLFLPPLLLWLDKDRSHDGSAQVPAVEQPG